MTGLQNQIRVQFSAIGHPVIGDRKYHKPEALERRIARVALHAAHLQFIHPRSGDSVSVDCESPTTFNRFSRLYRRPNVRAGKFSEALRTGASRSHLCG